MNLDVLTDDRFTELGSFPVLLKRSAFFAPNMAR